MIFERSLSIQPLKVLAEVHFHGLKSYALYINSDLFSIISHENITSCVLFKSFIYLNFSFLMLHIKFLNCHILHLKQLFASGTKSKLSIEIFFSYGIIPLPSAIISSIFSQSLKFKVFQT